ncbi:MAG TPA: hypothetical protein VHV57_07440 [Acidimicrobiales bacterium]|nr:hypothetical protein [Acidimicrobiales bacterium]
MSRGAFGGATDAGSRKYDLAIDLLHNKGPGAIQIVGATPHINGRLKFDGAFLLASTTNNPGGGIADAPFPLRSGESLTPITSSRPPIIKQGGKQFLVVRVNIPNGKMAGEAVSVVVHYRSGGHQYSTSYGVGVVLCRAKFVDGACGSIKDPTGGTTNS